MENKLKLLLDYNLFAPNDRIAKMVQETEAKYINMLSDDDLVNINAAGDIHSKNMNKNTEE